MSQHTISTQYDPIDLQNMYGSKPVPVEVKPQEEATPCLRCGLPIDPKKLKVEHNDPKFCSGICEHDFKLIEKGKAEVEDKMIHPWSDVTKLNLPKDILSTYPTWDEYKYQSRYRKINN